jgi:hypothetical protein
MSITVNTERKLVEAKYDKGDSTDEFIVAEAVGQADDPHTTGERPNSGLVVLAYPYNFSGKSTITIRGVESGEVIDGPEDISV